MLMGTYTTVLRIRLKFKMMMKKKTITSKCMKNMRTTSRMKMKKMKSETKIKYKGNTLFCKYCLIFIIF